MNRVIISTNINHSYDFLVPLTTAMWQTVAGYGVTVLLTGVESEWASDKLQLMINMARGLGADIRFVGAIEGYRTSVYAQASRQHAACIPYADDDYLLTSDQDMWPLSGPWFNQQDWSKDVHIWYANAYNYRFHTTGYIGMKAGKWREIMKIKAGDSIAFHLQGRLDKHITRECDTFEEWYFDEKYFNSRLKAWDGYPDRCQMIERIGAPPVDRIDRGNWPKKIDLAGKVDAHVLRPGFTKENWPGLKMLMECFLSSNTVVMLQEYRDEYERLDA